jgi:cell wall-associated NlpC family hydrolase
MTRLGRRLVTVSLLATILLFGAAAVAQAGTVVELRDPNLRAAVVSRLVEQGQLPPGSDGTTMTPSDLEALTSLSAPDSGITCLDGLELAVHLTTLDLHGNEIASVSPLDGLAGLTELDLSGNRLDTTADCPAMATITALRGRGTHVSHQPQRAALATLSVSSSAATLGKTATFSIGVAPRGAAVSGVSRVLLYHLETKTVTTTVRGVRKSSTVPYWRLRSTISMEGTATESLSAKGRLAYPGKWQAQVTYAGTADYAACTSTVRAFVVRDPRIEAAISWARRRLGSHSWDHHCLKFVGDSYERGARTRVRRFDTAKVAAVALHASLHKDMNAPRGAYVFYDSYHGRTNLGHVGISLGGGMMINAYGSHGVKIMKIKCTLHYLGWAAPPLTPRITDWDTAPAM